MVPFTIRRQRSLADAGLQSMIAGAFLEYCQQAIDAGDGGEDIAAVFKRISSGPLRG